MPIGSAYFKFVDGKSQADLRPDTIRLMTADEQNSSYLRESTSINIQWPDESGAYSEYSAIESLTYGIGEDKLNAPIITLPSGGGPVLQPQPPLIVTPVSDKRLLDPAFQLSVEGGAGTGALSYRRSDSSTADFTVSETGLVTLGTGGVGLAEIIIIKAGDICDYNQLTELNTQVMVSANSFTRAGYTFVGWNTQPNGQGTMCQPSDVLTMTANITLYAQWEREPLQSTALDAKKADAPL